MHTDQEQRQAARTKLIARFRATAADRLSRLANGVLQLERDGYSASASEELKREIHTLKGEAKLVGFADVSFLVHKIEEIVLYADEQRYGVDGSILDLILTGFDEAGVLIDPDASGGRSAELETYVALVDRALANATGAHAPAVENTLHAVAPAITGIVTPQRITQRIEIDPADLEKVSQIVGSLLEEQARRDREFTTVSSVVDRQRSGLDRVAGAWQQIASTTHFGNTTQRDRFAEMTMHIASLRKENLELRSVLRTSREESFSAALHLGELEERVRSMRMLPFSTLTDIYPRAVRDLARSLGKQVRLDITGGDVAVDTRILALLGEPLLHLVRNAVDHGIESPEQREQQGKSEVGLLHLGARQSGARLVVTLRDDGRGLDLDAIRATAAAKGLVSSEQLRALSDTAVRQLVFLPGFSTRSDVSEISGRGIGLDVVKRRVENVGGSASVHATDDGGSSFELNLPISLALVHVLIVRAGSSLWAIPSSSIVAITDCEESPRSQVAGVPVIRFGEMTIPLCDVPSQVGIKAQSETASSRQAIVVVRYGDTTIGMEGLQIIEYRSVVQRQADHFLEGLRLIEGTAALGDRQVAIILSPSELVRTALARGAAPALVIPAEERTPVVLVVDDSEIARSIVVDSLRTSGHRVLQAVDGGEALAMVQRETPDLIVLDLDMPVMNGFEVLEALRADARWQTIPVVVLSSRGSDADKRRAVGLGADAYLVKSRFDTMDLSDTVRTFLRHTQRRAPVSGRSS